jgi:hypothetical protein
LSIVSTNFTLNFILLNDIYSFNNLTLT